jgi:NarL family two-component system sensor histidine kinase YdfH
MGNGNAKLPEYNGSMSRIRDLLSSIFRSWRPSSEWPFMLFLTLVFLFIYILSIVSAARLQDPLTLTVFTMLFVVHLGLHWISFWWLEKRWNAGLYLGIQAALVFTLASISGVTGALLGLYLGLIGEAVGMLPAWRKKFAAVVGILGLSALNFVWVLQSGELFWWAAAVLPMTVFVIIYVVLYSRQADARVKAQELLAELEIANRRLTESADRIEDLTLTNERQRMARELHDTLAQGLAGLILQLEAADSHLDSQRPDRAQAIVQQAMTRARATLAESRRAIDGLRAEPSGGLEEAVRAEVEHFISASGVPCSLKLSLGGPLPDAVRGVAARLVSEGLTNAARHARARSASVALHQKSDALEIEVADDGMGFSAAEAERTGHYGLIGLRERARQAGGVLEIQSGEGKGTILRMRIPLPRQ